MENKGQATVFVIIALVIVAVIVIFFAVRGTLLGGENVDPEFAPIYTAYLGCIESVTLDGLSLLGTQGGRIEIGPYVPGSEFAPFSSDLSFLGTQVPYWYYVTGNNLLVENSPSKSSMEEALEGYITEQLSDCDFDTYYEQGFYLTLDETPEVAVSIDDEQVSVVVDASLASEREERSARKTRHEVEVASRVGALYDIARDIYDKQLTEAFLEDYAVDVLRNYAPVDGISIQCSPEIWETQEVVDTLHTALAANMGAVKIRGSNYVLDDASDDYFVVDIGREVDVGVSVLYSPTWPSVTEIAPGDEALLIAEPVGTQAGLGVMGFCYVPYHFVWDVKFPVMIQVVDGSELFQFPMAVIIDNNVAREATLMSIASEPVVDACVYYNGEIEVRTYDSQLQPVPDARVQYKCFESSCPVGTTELEGSEAVYRGGIPLCVNGELIVEAEGFVDQEILYSSNDQLYADVILQRAYDTEVQVSVDGGLVAGNAIVTFDDGRQVVTAALPELDSVVLHEGLYNVSVFVYGDSGITIPAARRRHCTDVPAGGLAGVFGRTDEECVDIELPATRVEYALIGGGSTSTYITESDLAAGQVTLDAEGFGQPTSLEALQLNYAALEGGVVTLAFP